MDYGQRETVTDLRQLYVYSSAAPTTFTLGQIARLKRTKAPDSRLG